MDSGQRKTNQILGLLERKLNILYKPPRQEVLEESEPYLEEVWEDIEDMTLPEKKRYVSKSKVPAIIAGIFAIKVVLANKKALNETNSALDKIYKANYDYMVGVFKAQGINIATGKNKNQGLSAFGKRSYNQLLETKYISEKMALRIQELIGQGKSIPVITKVIQREFNKNLNTSKLTARTESTRIENAARLDSFSAAQDLGLEFEKEWFATVPTDGRTRDSHIAMHTETAPIDELFSNGLMCPGDPNGEPGEVCNCRCCLIPSFGGDSD